MPSLRQQEPGYSKRRARVTAAAPNANRTLRFYGACCAVCGFRRGACATLGARARSRMPAASFRDASIKGFVAVADLTGLRSSRRARCDKLILSVYYSVNRAARRRRMPGVRGGLPEKIHVERKNWARKPRYPTRSASIRGVAQGLGNSLGEKAQVANILNFRELSSPGFLRGIPRFSCQNRL